MCACLIRNCETIGHLQSLNISLPNEYAVYTHMCNTQKTNILISGPKQIQHKLKFLPGVLPRGGSISVHTYVYIYNYIYIRYISHWQELHPPNGQNKDTSISYYQNNIIRSYGHGPTPPHPIFQGVPVGTPANFRTLPFTSQLDPIGANYRLPES